MNDIRNWDWEFSERVITRMSHWREAYSWIEEPRASLDGEKFAAVVRNSDGEYTVLENETAWEGGFDRVWNLRYTFEGKTAAFVSDMGQWTVAVDGQPWEGQYEFAWNMILSPARTWCARR